MKASLYEYDEKKTQEILKRQYMREGRDNERASIIRNMLQKGGLTLETIAEFVGAPVSQVEALANGMNLA